MPSRCIAAGAFVAWLAATSAFAMGPLITPTFQERRVAGTANASDLTDNVNDGDTQDAPDYGPFGAGASAQARVPDALGSGGGTQTSTIGPYSLFVTGTTFSNSESYSDDGFGDGGGQSLYRVFFDLAEASTYELTGTIAAYDNGWVDLALREGGGTLISSWQAFGPADSFPVNDTGPLAAGSYSLELDARGDTFADFFNFEYASSEFNVTFRVHVPGPGGVVPDGTNGQPLTVTDLGGGMVRLGWGSSCRMDDSDFAVYEGALGSFGVLQAASCSTAGSTQHDFVPAQASAFFLVVPTDGSTEGSYGTDSTGTERLPAVAPCLSQSLGNPVCP